MPHDRSRLGGSPGFLRRLSRRELVRDGALAAGTLMLPGAAFESGASAHASRSPTIASGPYGTLGPVDLATGVQAPEGFTVREIGRAGDPVGLTGYTWPAFPDGSGSFAQPDGSWIFVANSEIEAGRGGVSAIHFSTDGNILDAYRICGGTSSNCGGGTTPWGTWLTGEEVDRGRVLECDPKGEKEAVPRPALGLFSHEYILVHEREKKLYLTEDESSGGFYRFTPRTWGDLSTGLLEIATLRHNGKVSWSAIADPSAAAVPTREQVPQLNPGVSNMNKPEGLCIDHASGIVFFAESGAGRVIAYDPVSGVYELLYGEDDFDDPILTDTDNVAVSPTTGDLFICEDAGSFDICILTPEGEMAKFVNLSGAQHGEPTDHGASETTGPSFDPSGTRFYFSSQRAGVAGATYEVTGPWRERPGTTIRPRPQKVKLAAPRKMRRARLRQRGVRVTLTLDTLSSVAIELRARDLKGRRVILATAAANDVKPKRADFVLKPTRSIRGLEHVTLVATVAESVGRHATAKQRIRLRDG